MKFIPRTTRPIIYMAVVVVLMALAGFHLYAGDVYASTTSSSAFGTVPPPGGTIPLNMAGIKFVHTAPFASDSSVGVEFENANASFTFNPLDIGQSTGGYLAVQPGTVQVSVTPTDSLFPSLTQNIVVSENQRYTVVAVGGTSGWPLELLILNDTASTPSFGQGKIRVVHAAPFGPSTDDLKLNVRIQSAPTRLALPLNGIDYKETRGYFSVPIGEYDWEVTFPDSTIYVNSPPFVVGNGQLITLYILGDGNNNQGPATLFVVDDIGQPIRKYYAPLIFNQ